MSKDAEITLTCCQCGKEFTFSTSEQEYYKERGFVLPRHCKQCRSARQNHNSSPCSSCGNEIEKGTSMYCAACLAAVQLECELETRKQNILLAEANTRIKTLEADLIHQKNELEEKLNASESERMKLVQSIEEKIQAFNLERQQLVLASQQKEQELAEIGQKLANTSRELQESHNYHTNLDWLEPMLKTFKERLDALERTQNNLNNFLLQSTQLNEMENEHNNISEAFKRVFRSHHRSPAPGG